MKGYAVFLLLLGAGCSTASETFANPDARESKRGESVVERTPPVASSAPQAPQAPPPAPDPTRTYSAALASSVALPAQSPSALSPREVLTLDIPLRGGEVVEVDAVARIDGPATLVQPMLAAAALRCSEDILGKATVWTLSNWGAAPQAADGTDVSVRQTATAQRDGVATCKLMAVSGAGSFPPGAEMTVVGGGNVTRLAVRVLPKGAESRSAFLSTGVETLEAGTSSLLTNRIDAPLAYGRVKVTSDLQISTCVPGAVSRGWCSVEGSSAFSSVATRLRIVQFDKDGVNVCAQTNVPADNAAITTVSNSQHHAKLRHDAEVVLDPRCGPRVESRLDVHVLAGNPILSERGFLDGASSTATLVATP